MQRLSTIPTISDLILRVASLDPATKTWTCSQCGVIPAKELKRAPGYYIRQSCPCEERLRQQQASDRERTERQRQNLEQTYAWIGREWADSALAKKTFATFTRTCQPKAFETAYTFAQQPRGVLVLFGNYGVGKTHLLAAIANACSKRERPGLYVSAVTLFEVLQERIQQNRDYHDLLKRAIHAPLLLIDDLDKPKASEFRESIYYHLIDKRTLAGRPLAISSNVPPLELEHWIGGAARSRLLMNLLPVEMQGSDYRLGGAQHARS